MTDLRESNSSELHEPPLRLEITGMRWAGEEWEVFDQAARLELHSTDVDEDSVAILRALRRIAVRRLDMAIAGVALTREALDFDAPNPPTEEDVAEMLSHARRLVGLLEVLKQVSPEVVVEVEDGDDG